MTDQEAIEKIAEELFDIWKEAKSTEIENWDDQTFDKLPNEHKEEYYLTAQRIISYVYQIKAGNFTLGELVDLAEKGKVVVLDDDQSLPKNKGYSRVEQGIEHLAQQDMLNAGFKKVLRG